MKEARPERGASVRSRSPRQQAWLRLRRNRRALVAGVVLLVMVLGAALVPIVSSFGSEQQALEEQLQGPGWRHLMGTDLKGRDLMTRIFAGARVSLFVGLAATFVCVLIGVAYGALSGYAGGKADAVMMRLVDILYGLPFMVVVLVVMAIVRNLPDITAQWNLLIIFLVLGAVQWLTIARIVRAEVLSARQRDYVEAARALGTSPARILLRHLLPNIAGPVLIYATLTVPMIILEESFLSFLGLGIQPPQTSWGILIADGAQSLNALQSYWWLIVFPAFFLGVTLLCLNTLGDGLRDALDPRSRSA